MAKIALLTLPLDINYGGNLQAFALQQTLIKLGHEVHVLNFKKKEGQPFKKLLSNLKRMVFFREILNTQKLHTQFIRENIHITEKLYTLESLKNYIRDYNIETIVVGSDQVWRKNYVMAHTSDMLNFFLNFVSSQEVNKISYAASFGVDEWQFDEEMTAEIKKLMHDFQKISVREDSAKKLCVENLGINTEHVLDPTMLLDIEDYEKLIKTRVTKEEIAKCKGKIFSYVLDSSPYKDEIQQHISEVLNKRIIHNKILNLFQLRHNTMDRLDTSIEHWLMAFKYCDYVITDSFHGTVFAILFRKPFIVLVNKQRGATRFYSLLKMLDLENRIVEDITNINKEYLYKIDYDAVHNKLDVLKKNSLRFLLS